MTRSTKSTRRDVLQTTAGAIALGLAGCVSTAGGASEEPTTGHHDEEGEEPAGHGESEHHHDTVSEPKESREVLVNTARNAGTDAYHFKPHVTWVSVGGTVTWKLESGTHTATTYHPGNDEPRLVPEGTDAWDSGTLSEEGETYSHTFDTEGVYHYFCEPHEQFGMLGTVIVGQPHPEEQIALGKIPEDKPEEVHGKLKSLNEMVQSILGGGHHEEETETGHHHDEETESGHHEEETEPGHHEEGTESGHHEGTGTVTDHHDE